MERFATRGQDAAFVELNRYEMIMYVFNYWMDHRSFKSKVIRGKHFFVPLQSKFSSLIHLSPSPTRHSHPPPHPPQNKVINQTNTGFLSAICWSFSESHSTQKILFLILDFLSPLPSFLNLISSSVRWKYSVGEIIYLWRENFCSISCHSPCVTQELW